MLLLVSCISAFRYCLHLACISPLSRFPLFFCWWNKRYFTRKIMCFYNKTDNGPKKYKTVHRISMFIYSLSFDNNNNRGTSFRVNIIIVFIYTYCISLSKVNGQNEIRLSGLIACHKVIVPSRKQCRIDRHHQKKKTIKIFLVFNVWTSHTASESIEKKKYGSKCLFYHFPYKMDFCPSIFIFTSPISSLFFEAWGEKSLPKYTFHSPFGEIWYVVFNRRKKEM